MKLDINTNSRLTGSLLAVSAYVMWGFSPVYWKLLGHMPSVEVLAHRFIWSFVFMIVVLLVTRKMGSFWAECRALCAQPKQALLVFLAAVVVAGNWYLFIWAVSVNQVLAVSLGYYINPLISVMFGILLLRERLSNWQLVALALAVFGVLYMIISVGSVPWVALALAGTFALYGLCKKLVGLSPAASITLETMIITPAALWYLIPRHLASFYNGDPVTAGLLVGSGVVTALPLLLFAAGVKQIPLYLVGFLQYIGPTIVFLLGVLLYNEPFGNEHLIAYLFIWAALLIISFLNLQILKEERVKA